MFKISNLLLVAGLACLPIAVQAESGSPASERTYCAKLSEIYVRYVGHDNSSPDKYLLRGANDAQVATTQCQTNTAWAIPILEQQLAANKFTLPTRD